MQDSKSIYNAYAVCYPGMFAMQSSNMFLLFLSSLGLIIISLHLCLLSHPDDMVLLWVYSSRLPVLILCIVSVNASRCLASIGLNPGCWVELQSFPSCPFMLFPDNPLLMCNGWSVIAL